MGCVCVLCLGVGEPLWKRACRRRRHYACKQELDEEDVAQFTQPPSQLRVSPLILSFTTAAPQLQRLRCLECVGGSSLHTLHTLTHAL